MGYVASTVGDLWMTEDKTLFHQKIIIKNNMINKIFAATTNLQSSSDRP
jgi:hypothetical protein